jgi:hypothetical protein
VQLAGAERAARDEAAAGPAAKPAAVPAEPPAADPQKAGARGEAEVREAAAPDEFPEAPAAKEKPAAKTKPTAKKKPATTKKPAGEG